MSRPGRTGHHGQLVAAYTGPTGFRQSGELRRKIRQNRNFLQYQTVAIA
jgi:hypothetical protein